MHSTMFLKTHVIKTFGTKIWLMVLFQEFEAKSEMNGSKKEKKRISQYLVSVSTELFLQSTKHVATSLRGLTTLLLQRRWILKIQVSIQLEIQFLLFFNEGDPMKALF